MPRRCCVSGPFMHSARAKTLRHRGNPLRHRGRGVRPCVWGKIPEQVSKMWQEGEREPHRVSWTQLALNRDSWRQAVDNVAATMRGGVWFARVTGFRLRSGAFSSERGGCPLQACQAWPSSGLWPLCGRTAASCQHPCDRGTWSRIHVSRSKIASHRLECSAAGSERRPLPCCSKRAEAESVDAMPARGSGADHRRGC